MEQLQFNVKHQIITRTDSFETVARSQNYLRAKFNFLTDEWQGTKTALFEANGHIYEVILDQNDTCYVPFEALSVGDSFIIVSVFCGDRLTTNTAKIYVRQSGYSDDSESGSTPPASVYNQILENLELLNASYAQIAQNLERLNSGIDGGTFEDWKE